MGAATRVPVPGPAGSLSAGSTRPLKNSGGASGPGPAQKDPGRFGLRFRLEGSQTPIKKVYTQWGGNSGRGGEIRRFDSLRL